MMKRKFLVVLLIGVLMAVGLVLASCGDGKCSQNNRCKGSYVGGRFEFSLACLMKNCNVENAKGTTDASKAGTSLNCDCKS